jgi:hypothetical protein
MHGLSTTEFEGTPAPDPHAGGRAAQAVAQTPSRARSALQTAERDRDAAQASRDRFSFLAEASRCLSDSLDYEATLTTVAGTSLPYPDAWCAGDIIGAEAPWRSVCRD